MSKNTTGEIPATGLPSRRRPTHPGVILLEQFLRELPMTRAEAARRMNMPVTRVNELVRGRRGVTAPSALRLGRLMGTTPVFWMNLQANWDLWHAQEQERQRGRTSEPPGLAVAEYPGKVRPAVEHRAGRSATAGSGRPGTRIASPQPGARRSRGPSGRER